jgi:hypothetical protein
MNLTKELAKLEKMSVGELRERFAEVCGETTSGRNKTWLIRRIAWRLQANAEGGLSERALARARELANDADLRVTAPKANPVPATPHGATRAMTLAKRGDDRLPLPGTVITRDYKGKTLRVTVLAKGFEFEGEVYKSLSAVAKAITGSHCNGFLFFRMGGAS